MAASGNEQSSAGKIASEDARREKIKSRVGLKNRIHRRLVCFSGGPAEEERQTGEGDSGRIPTHLVIMINGIVGSAKNWRFAEKQFLRRRREGIVVHCSTSNGDLLTLDGIDVMGRRLAEEVLSIVKHRPELEKISFVGHSLGGLVARYAIAELYEPINPRSSSDEDDGRKEGKIGGLDPMNFITFATPHIGSRWRKQIPILCGVPLLEKMARRSSWILGRTGRQLFLDDNDRGKPPLLVQMVDDGADLRFISALRSFRRRVAYSNARFDHIVGWKTSSIRRQHELPAKKLLRGIIGYPHIMRVEPPKSLHLDHDTSPDMQEAMINSLNKVTWERVDVSFHKTVQRLFAHNTIQVKTPCLNSAGADVISHLIDNFLLKIRVHREIDRQRREEEEQRERRRGWDQVAGKLLE